MRHRFLRLIAISLVAGCAGESAPEPARPVAMWALTSDSEEAHRLVERGILVEDLWSLPGNLPWSAEANAAFKEAIALDPEFAFAYLRAAATAPSHQEQWENLKQARALAGGASEAEQLLIEMHWKLFHRDLEGSRDAALRLLRRDSTHARVWLELARLQSAMGEEAEARASATEAIRREPKHVAAHMWLGESHTVSQPQDLAVAERHARAAVELAPERASPYDLLGDVLRAKGQLREAADAYTRATAQDDAEAQVFQQRGHVHSFLGNYQQARADYDTSFARTKSGISRGLARTYRAMVSLHEGNPAAAVRELEQVVQEIPRLGAEDPDRLKDHVLSHQAVIALHTGMFEDAERAVTRRNELLRKQAEAVGTDEFRREREAEIGAWEGMLAAYRGDHVTAIRKAREAMKLRKTDRDPTRDRMPHAVLGIVALRQARHAEAVAHLEQSDPNNPYFQYQHALALEGAGRAQEAKELFGTVARNNFNSPAVVTVRQDALARSR